jgi:hypothetical protein
MKALLLLVCLVAVDAQAQTGPSVIWPVQAGARVRVVSPAIGSDAKSGKVVFASADSLSFRPAKEDMTLTIPTANIVGMEVAEGTHTRKAKGMLAGFVIGAGTGAILGAAAYKKDACAEFCLLPDSRAFEATMGGAFVGIVGSVVGLIVGAHAVDTWVPVALPGR